jgi:hypothetical protein
MAVWRLERLGALPGTVQRAILGAVPRPWDRIFFALTAACAFVGMLMSVILAGNSSAEHLVRYFSGSAARGFNTFAYFTIQANLLVFASTLLLALRPDRDEIWFRVLRLSGLVAITVTGIVYHAVLRGLVDLKDWHIIADQLVHSIVPALTVVGWLVFGPRGLADRTVIWRSLAFPIVWVTFTLIRGAIYPWYPYPFIDVSQIGYTRAAFNCLWVALLMLGIAALAGWLDRRLRSAEPVPAG